MNLTLERQLELTEEMALSSFQNKSALELTISQLEELLKIRKSLSKIAALQYLK